MNPGERIRQMVDDNYDDSREDTIRSMLSEFYSRKMAATAALVWAVGIPLLAVAVYCAVAFFRTDQTKSEILYATIFLTCFIFIGLLKVFAWQTIHRNSIKREIKRLELRIAELASSGSKTTR
jgi:multisubunit Na+/H+ antiporter MnhG subunit